ncbi:hypothetical protein NQ317_013758 [Molorchus minor]|uniref:Uncharacterized protein n=1 Tax=Molorchus minor TaxID=1323400 RepID=A0ABQ9JT46_9CUCU|nr:hypothetical protein NQ317_013758 [Molorchus minor]
MSKIRNRSVKVLPYELSNVLTSSSSNTFGKGCQEVNYFGENIQDVDASSPYMPLSRESPRSVSALTSGDMDSITLELNKLSGLSSSSSLSWSDEYESDTSKKDTRRAGKNGPKEPIPSHYDRDEYEEWMNTFPNLSIFDREITPTNSTHNILETLEEKGDELKVYGNDMYNVLNCDNLTSNKRKKEAVIRIKEISPEKLLNQRSANTLRKRKLLEEHRNKNKNLFTISHKPKSLDTEKYLKISPIKSQVSINDRKSSSKSMLNRELCKEYSDVLPEYNSLPFIKIEELDFSNNGIASGFQYRKSSSEKYRKKIDKHLILPPIVTSSQFRSVSATPRQGIKTLSAFSTKFDSFKEQKSRKLSVSFLDNPVTNRIHTTRFSTTKLKEMFELSSIDIYAYLKNQGRYLQDLNRVSTHISFLIRGGREFGVILQTILNRGLIFQT